jgi:catechol 2,3-dioxygenase-like lactoylglutathione lyase family enzyme
MTTTTVGLQRMSLVCVPTIEQDAAIAFYEALGFEKRTDEEFGDRYRWVEVYLPQDAAGIALAPPPSDAELLPVQTGIVLTSRDIDATHAHMRERGVDVDAEVSRMGGPVPPMFWFRDPTGHSLMIVEQP